MLEFRVAINENNKQSGPKKGDFLYSFFQLRVRIAGPPDRRAMSGAIRPERFSNPTSAASSNTCAR